MRMMKHLKDQRCDEKRFRGAHAPRVLATLCSRFLVGSVRVARRATATVEALQSTASTDLLRTCINGR